MNLFLICLSPFTSLPVKTAMKIIKDKLKQDTDLKK